MPQLLTGDEFLAVLYMQKRLMEKKWWRRRLTRKGEMSTQKPWQSGKLEKEAQQSEKRCLETSCSRLTSPARLAKELGIKWTGD